MPLTVDCFLTLRQLNWFFTLYGCTRLAFIEGQHRCELTSRAGFGFRVDQESIGVPLLEDDERYSKYNTSSSIYLTVGISIVAEKIQSNCGQYDPKINLQAFQELSRKAQFFSNTSLATPAVNTFLKIFDDLAINLKTTKFQSSFLGDDVTHVDDIDKALYKHVCLPLGQYPVKIISFVESTIHRLLIEEEPFKLYITQGHLKQQAQRLQEAFTESRRSSGAWMWIGSGKNDQEILGKGPIPTFHHSFTTLICTGERKSFKIHLQPYDVENFKRNVVGRLASFLPKAAVTNAPYCNSLVATSLHYMVIELTQYALCFPFVRDSFRTMVSSIDATTHPVNDPVWFAMYVLLPCKSIAEIMLYHITKKMRVLHNNQQLPQTTIFPITDDMTLKDLKKKKIGHTLSQTTFIPPAGSQLQEPHIQNNEDEGTDGRDDDESTTNGLLKYEKQLKLQRELTIALNNILRHNTNARYCDPLMDKTLKSISSYSSTRGKIVSFVYARAMEMYFNLLTTYSKRKTLHTNVSLTNLRDAIIKLQATQATENGENYFLTTVCHNHAVYLFSYIFLFFIFSCRRSRCS